MHALQLAQAITTKFCDQQLVRCVWWLEKIRGTIKRHYDGDIMRCIIGIYMYPLVIEHSHGKSPFLIGKPSINGPFFHGYVK